MLNKSGILLIDKEVNYTSRDVVNLVCKKLETKKVGHTGTLDPFATGLLVVTCFEGTKINQFLESMTKEYIATLKLGEQTDTLDLEGKIVNQKEVKLPLDEDKIKEVLNSFIGEIEQVPPMYSAIKQDGKKLYELARENKIVERKKRLIKIYSIDLLEIKDQFITFKVVCSKGTYIRTLGEDIASKLDNYGHLVSLRRTKVGKFKVEDAKKIDEISEEDIISIIEALDIKKIELSDKINKQVKNGVKLHLEEDDELILFVENNSPIAIYKKQEDNLYHCERGFRSEDN